MCRRRKISRGGGGAAGVSGRHRVEGLFDQGSRDEIGSPWPCPSLAFLGVEYADHISPVSDAYPDDQHITTLAAATLCEEREELILQVECISLKSHTADRKSRLRQCRFRCSQPLEFGNRRIEGVRRQGKRYPVMITERPQATEQAVPRPSDGGIIRHRGSPSLQLSSRCKGQCEVAPVHLLSSD